MNKYSRQDLDRLGSQISGNPILEEDDDLVLVNGMLGEYSLWYPKGDRSVLPCLTGEIGGMQGAWENWITAWHTQHLEEYDTYIDIGANGGYFAGLAAVHDLVVLAVEANPEYVRALRKTADENEFDQFTVIDKAISDEIGEVTLMVPRELHGGASIAGNETNLSGDAVSVKAVTLDSFDIPAAGRVLIKMDIEGAEQAAFRGAVKFNKKYKPTYIIEYTSRHYDGKFFDELLSYGEVTMVDFDGNEIPVTKSYADSQDDWITLVIRQN